MHIRNTHQSSNSKNRSDLEKSKSLRKMSSQKQIIYSIDTILTTKVRMSQDKVKKISTLNTFRAMSMLYLSQTLILQISKNYSPIYRSTTIFFCREATIMKAKHKKPHSKLMIRKERNTEKEKIRARYSRILSMSRDPTSQGPIL